MKKVLLFAFAIALGIFCACEDKTKSSYEYRDLGDEVTNLKVKAPSESSIFDEFVASFNMPINKVLTDSKTGMKVKIMLDSVVCLHQRADESTEKVAGKFELKSDTSISYKVLETVVLDEPYYLYLYFSWFKEDGVTRIADNGNNDYYRALWAEYKPTIIDGKSIIFGTTRGGMNTNTINVYDGDMLIELPSDIFFDSIGAVANSQKDIAFLVNSIEVKSNKADDYVVWKGNIDTLGGKVHFTSEIPDKENHLSPGIYYTVDITLDYVKKVNGKWQAVVNVFDEPVKWRYKKVFGTTGLFVPSTILSYMAPSKGFISIDSVPMVQMSRSNLVEEELDGILFRPSLSKFELSDEAGVIPSNFKWVEKGDYAWASKDSMGATLEPDSVYLIPGHTYTLSVEAFWEYKISAQDTVWKVLKSENGQVKELAEGVFTSALSKPGNIVMDITPNDENAGMTEDVVVTFKYPIGKEFDNNGIKFRPVLDYYGNKLSSSNVVVHETYTFAENKSKAIIHEPDMYYPNTKYVATVKSHWEYKDKNGIWKQLNVDMQDVMEENTQEYETKGRPVSIYRVLNMARSNNPINAIPNVYLNIVRGQTYQVDGIEFKPVFDESYIELNGTDVVIDHTLSWQGDTMIILDPVKMYDAETIYLFNFIAHWEYRKISDNGAAWRVHPDTTNICNERPTRTFKTAGKPGVIVSGYSLSSEDADVNTDIILGSNFSLIDNSPYGGTMFKIVTDSVDLYNGTDVVESVKTNNTAADQQGLIINPVADLQFNTTYSLKGSMHWEYLKDGAWIILPSGKEQISYTFTTKAGE